MSKSASKRPPNPSASLVFFSATTGPPCLPNHSNNRHEDKQCNVRLVRRMAVVHGMADGGWRWSCTLLLEFLHEHGTAVRRGGNPARHARAQPEPLSRCLQIGPDTVRPALFYFEVYKSETIEQLPTILAHHGGCSIGIEEVFGAKKHLILSPAGSNTHEPKTLEPKNISTT
ncbi:hypothetical protein B0H10DRAFT_1953989 [Mycena sp. CBHHK59/15]|nr:hypothetical protein B0H10DRAFT_1953989 [Mycena sp. CBHHK59/15]